MGDDVPDKQIAVHYERMRGGLQNMVPNAVDVVEMPPFVDFVDGFVITVMVLNYSIEGE